MRKDYEDEYLWSKKMVRHYRERRRVARNPITTLKHCEHLRAIAQENLDKADRLENEVLSDRENLDELEEYLLFHGHMAATLKRLDRKGTVLPVPKIRRYVRRIVSKLLYGKNDNEPE